MNAVGARDVACRSDDPALSAADDHRLVGKRGVVAFFDGGIERVAVDMGDRQGVDLRVTRQSRRAAGGTARGGLRYVGETVPAKAHGTSRSQGLPARARRPRSISAGSRPVSLAKAMMSLSSEAT